MTSAAAAGVSGFGICGGRGDGNSGGGAVEMIEKGMGLIYGVGKAASSGPRIVYLEYKGDPSSSDTVRTEAICRCVLFMGIF